MVLGAPLNGETNLDRAYILKINLVLAALAV